MFRAAEAATEKPSMEVPGDTTDRALAPAAIAVLPAWGLEEEAVLAVVVGAAVAVVEVVGGVDKMSEFESGNEIIGAVI
jgi:hypothetical protein